MALTAIPVGFVAGLFGIGGGLITVPFLYFIFGSLEIDPQYIRSHVLRVPSINCAGLYMIRGLRIRDL